MGNDCSQKATQETKTVEQREEDYLKWVKLYKRNIPNMIKEIDLKLQSGQEKDFQQLHALWKEKSFAVNYSNTNEMSCMLVICGIYEQELQDNIKETILHKNKSFLQLYNYIKELKFLIWRTEFISSEENFYNLLVFLRDTNTSVQTILYMLHQISIKPYATTLNLANLYLDLGNTAIAFRLLKYANELNPGDEVVLCFMAQICLSVHQIEAAKDCLEQILHPTQMAEKIGQLCGINDIHHKSVKTPCKGITEGVRENKIAFITCVNNTTQYEQCVYYIKRLHIPDGYEIELVPIYDAQSMTNGYNKGMHQTDAKYKVYLHQDAYILEQDYLYYMLHIFGENETIGLMGIGGVKSYQESGIYYNKIDEGTLYSNEEVLLIAYGKNNYKYPENRIVFAVDGVCMMTQYDLPWREDIFDGWDFYDISQSVEFQKAGYEVVVPYQENIWLLHDCNYPKLKNYEKYKDIFFTYYQQENKKQIKQEVLAFNQEKEAIIQSYIETFDRLYQTDRQKAFASIQQVVSSDLQEANFFYVQSAGRIYKEENIHGYDVFLKDCHGFMDIFRRYKEYEYHIRRIEFPNAEQRCDLWLEEKITQTPESMYALITILFEKGIKKKAVLEKMQSIYQRMDCKSKVQFIQEVLERQINE